MKGGGMKENGLRFIEPQLQQANRDAENTNYQTNSVFNLRNGNGLRGEGGV